MMGDHAIAIGFVMSFSPYVLEVVISFVYIILRAIYEYRKQFLHSPTKQIKTSSPQSI